MATAAPPFPVYGQRGLEDTLEGMLTLHLVRHALTAPNLHRRYPAPGEDAGLTPEGLVQAAALSLPAQAQAFSSPSLRCRQTAQQAGFPQVVLDQALIEADFGVMAGQTWAELERAYHLLPFHWIEALRNPTLDFGPPRGETGRAFHARLLTWLERLPPAGEVVAFTHAGPILALLRLTVNLASAQIGPATVVTLKRANEEWWLEGLAGSGELVAAAQLPQSPSSSNS